MPWNTPTLRDVRSMVRDNIRGSLPGADASVPNSVLRVMSDVMGALCHLALQYIDWLALQLLPDTAETEWLDRHGDIWLVNADGTTGRKGPTLAQGFVTCTGTVNAVVPLGAQLTGANGVQYETLTFIILGSTPTPVEVRALDPGTIGNLDTGETMGFVNIPTGVDGNAVVESIDGGTDEETDDELRARILLRIQQPPMGGDAKDYVQWAVSVPGCTRAWCYPNEMGIGTVTVRVMFDDLRADNNGLPIVDDLATVQAYIDSVRPVAIKDRWVTAPIPYWVDHTIYGLVNDTQATRNSIRENLLDIFRQRTAPGAPWYRAWSEEAINQAGAVVSFDLSIAGDVRHVTMPSPGFMPMLGTIVYAS
jgi:uncharacterized phage protein gp47/JayE